MTLPTTDIASLFQWTNDIDNVSMEIMLKYHPAYTEENIALKTVGDGNCLYRAISKKLTGTEQYHKLLRLETALEIIIFSDKYDSKSKTKLDFITDTRTVTSNVNKLIEDAVKLGSYSELAHMYAISASLVNQSDHTIHLKFILNSRQSLLQELLWVETLNYRILFSV